MAHCQLFHGGSSRSCDQTAKSRHSGHIRFALDAWPHRHVRYPGVDNRRHSMCRHAPVHRPIRCCCHARFPSCASPLPTRSLWDREMHGTSGGFSGRHHRAGAYAGASGQPLHLPIICAQWWQEQAAGLCQRSRASFPSPKPTAQENSRDHPCEK